MGLSSVVLKELALGLNTRDSPYELKLGESPACQNVIPANKGQSWKRRPGIDQWNFNMVATTPLQNMLHWVAKDLLLVTQAGDLWSASSAQFATPWTKRFDSAITSTFNPWCLEIAKDGAAAEKLWAVNGNDPPQKWDGVTATTVAWTNPPPQACTWIKMWKNRMVAGGNPNFPERLYYSNIGNPELPAAWNFIDIRSSYDDSDLIVWAELIGDNLLVFKPQSTWLVYDSNTFANRRLGYPGVQVPNASCNLNGVIYFLNEAGLWITDGITEPRPVDMKIELSLSARSNYVVRSCTLLADPQHERLIIIIPTGSLTSVVYYFYPPNSVLNPHGEPTWWGQVFTPNLYTAVILTPTGTVNPNGFPILLGGSVDGDVYQIEDPQSPFGQFVDKAAAGDATVVAYWTSGVIQLSKGMEKLERVRRLNLRYRTQSAFAAAGSRYPGSPQASQSPPNISNVVTLTAEPNTVTFVTTVLQADPAAPSGFVRLRPELRGRQFQLRLDNNGASTQTFELRGVELVFRGGREHGDR